MAIVAAHFRTSPRSKSCSKGKPARSSNFPKNTLRRSLQQIHAVADHSQIAQWGKPQPARSTCSAILQ